MYQLEILDEAAQELRRLDQQVARRIVKRLYWLAENLDVIKLEALTGSLAGLNKLRVGDYRVVYQVDCRERVIVIHLIGHRSEIYRKG